LYWRSAKESKMTKDTGGRYFVDEILGFGGMKNSLQRKLNEGDAKGWELLWIEKSDKFGFFLVVWDRSRKT